MSIVLDIFLFLIIIAIIVVLLWGGLTNWTFKSQVSPPSTYIITIPPQTPSPPQIRPPPPQIRPLPIRPPQCPQNTYKSLDNIPSGCYNVTNNPDCPYTTQNLQNYSWQDCLNSNLSWKGDIPVNMRYDCVRDRWGNDKCVPSKKGRYISNENCEKYCKRSPWRKGSWNCGSALKGPSTCYYVDNNSGDYDTQEECRRKCVPALPPTKCCCGQEYGCSRRNGNTTSCNNNNDCPKYDYCVKYSHNEDMHVGCNNASPPVPGPAPGPRPGSNCASRGRCPAGMIPTENVNPPCCEQSPGPRPTPTSPPGPRPGSDCASRGMVSCAHVQDATQKCAHSVYDCASPAPPDLGPGGGIHHKNIGGATLHLGQEYFRAPSQVRIHPDNLGRMNLRIPEYYY